MRNHAPTQTKFHISVHTHIHARARIYRQHQQLRFRCSADRYTTSKADKHQEKHVCAQCLQQNRCEAKQTREKNSKRIDATAHTSDPLIVDSAANIHVSNICRSLLPVVVCLWHAAWVYAVRRMIELVWAGTNASVAVAAATAQVTVQAKAIATKTETESTA